MKPGRELDALIAERVMGFKKRSDGYFDGPDWFYSLSEEYDNMNGPKLIPHYSTSIEAAWEVVDKMQHEFTFGLMKILPLGSWQAKFASGWIDGDTAPHAICLAALKAVEG